VTRIPVPTPTPAPTPAPTQTATFGGINDESGNLLDDSDGFPILDSSTDATLSAIYALKTFMEQEFGSLSAKLDTIQTTIATGTST
jgi:hypothetical protein